MKKYHLFDISFVTAVLILFAAVLTIWSNFYPAIETEGTLPSITKFYGWPLRAATVSDILEGDGGIEIGWNFPALAIDAAIVALILVCVVLVGQRFARSVAMTKAAWIARPWHILHLSTAVTLTFVAGGLLCTNFVWQDMGEITVKLPDTAIAELKQNGTPVRVTEDDQPLDFKFVEMKQQGAGWPFIFRYRPESFLWEGARLLADNLFGLTVLAVVHSVCEGWIQRKGH